MACNCATDEQISKIYSKLGLKRNTDNLTFTKKVIYNFQRNFMYMVLLFSVPLTLLYISNEYRRGNNKISFKDFLVLDNVE